MHGGDYAWILPSDTIDPLRTEDEKWHSGSEECTPSQLSQAQNGLIIVRSLGSALGNEMSSSGLTSNQFAKELARRGVTDNSFARETYDAVWAMALALENTESLLNKENISIGHYTHARKDIALRLLEQLKLLRFVGVSVSGIARSRRNEDVPCFSSV
ncbi:hypothetical protein K0M31_004918 [Melipona bicolor]|uniref:Uncharacterized protein n=1 Tax=Melipona bicolor TaxID=60889 RepID=A0AA40FVT7_9HYME|nr:hypothetical protein K0M31_004918 [Melipona bicolor]